MDNEYEWREEIEKENERLIDMGEYYRAFLGAIETAGQYYEQKKKASTPGGDAGVDIELQNRNDARWGAMRNLDVHSREMGFPPMSEQDVRRLMDYFKSPENRVLLRNNIRRYQLLGELKSPKELVIMLLSHHVKQGAL